MNKRTLDEGIFNDNIYQVMFLNPKVNRWVVNDVVSSKSQAKKEYQGIIDKGYKAVLNPIEINKIGKNKQYCYKENGQDVVIDDISKLNEIAKSHYIRPFNGSNKSDQIQSNQETKNDAFQKKIKQQNNQSISAHEQQPAHGSMIQQNKDGNTGFVSQQNKKENNTASTQQKNSTNGLDPQFIDTFGNGSKLSDVAKSSNKYDPNVLTLIKYLGQNGQNKPQYIYNLKHKTGIDYPELKHAIFMAKNLGLLSVNKSESEETMTVAPTGNLNVWLNGVNYGKNL